MRTPTPAEILAALSRAAERLDNLLGALALPLPDRIHMQGIRETLPDIRAEMAAVLVPLDADPAPAPAEGDGANEGGKEGAASPGENTNSAPTEPEYQRRCYGCGARVPVPPGIRSFPNSTLCGTCHAARYAPDGTRKLAAPLPSDGRYGNEGSGT